MRGVDGSSGRDGLTSGPAGGANVLSQPGSGPPVARWVAGGPAGRDELWRAGSVLGGGLGSASDGWAGAGPGRSGDEDEGVFPPKGSTTDCSPQWGQRTTVVPTRSGFFDLIALEHRLHGNWVTNASRNWRRAPATSPASASRRAGSGSRQARQIASRSLGTL